MAGISILEVFRQRLPADSPLKAKIENYFADPEGYRTNRDLGLEMIRHSALVIVAEPILARALAQATNGAEQTSLLAALGMVFTMRAHFEGAVQVFTALAGRDRDFLLDLGDALFKAGRFAEASKAQADLVDRSYALAEARGGPVTQLLSSARLVCIRYGEMANKLDFYVKARTLGLVPPVDAILLAPRDQVVNECLMGYWRDQGRPFFTVLSDPKEIADAVAAHSDSAHHLDYVRMSNGRVEHRQLAYSAIQKIWDEQRRPPVLALTPEHRTRGREALQRLGVPDGAWFACLHVRESSTHGENTPWDPNARRSADVETYGAAIETVVARGGYVLRMGDPSLKPLPSMKNVIDFAHLDDDVRTDWLDVFLLASCRFIIATPSGPAFVAWTFGVPIVGTNWFPPGYWPFSARDLFIPKLLRRGDGRFLAIGDAVAPPIAGTVYPGFYQARGLDVIDNEPEDIAAVAVEMMDRLDGRGAYGDEDERLQTRFRERAAFDSLVINSRIGREFLHRHRFLIED